MTTESFNQIRWPRWIAESVRDVRHAIRTLARSPAFTLTAVAMLAVGTGANTAVFGVVDRLFLRQPAGVRNAEQLIRLYIVRDEGMVQTRNGGGGSYIDYRTIRQHVASLSGIAAFLDPDELDLGSGSDARQVRGQAVSGNYFTELGVRMVTGRPFQPEDDSTAGTHPVVIISHGLWRSQFGSEANVVGRSLLINGRSVVLVGVAEEGFKGVGLEGVDVWVPMAMATPLGMMGEEGGDWRDIPFMAAVQFVARLAHGVRPDAAASQAAAALQHAAMPDLDPTPRVLLGTLVAASGPSRPGFADLSLWLLGVTGLILLMVCANLANLFLARSARRRREMASRLALGASPSRLVRQVLAESLVLTLVGMAAGLLMASWGSLATARLSTAAGTGELGGRLLGFGALIALVSGTIPALVSAIGAVRSDPGRWLTETRTMVNPGGGRIRSALVAVQVALSAILLTGTALFVRSMGRVASVDPGLDTKRVLVVSMSLVRAGYDPSRRDAIYEAARARLRQLPGVEQVTTTHFVPLEGLRYSTDIRVAGRAESLEQHPYVNWVGGGYFETVGTAVLRGRGIQESDRLGRELVAVVNQTLARMLAPKGDAIGICLVMPSRMRRDACVTVVGVARDQRDRYLDAATPPVIYLARAQHPDPAAHVDAYLLVRTREDPGTIAHRMRESLWALFPSLPFISVEALRDRLRPELNSIRLGAALFCAFGAIALAVAAAGLYCVISYFVSERRTELAIRQSLGATRAEVVGFVLRQSALPISVGIIVGLSASFVAGRLIETLLFGVSGRDLLSYVVAAATLAVISLLSSAGPAWRGATIDPMVALRAE